MNIEEYINEKLWPILTEVVHALVMYPTHKAYIRDEILNGRPNTTPEELTFRLHIPLGEAIVILYELRPKSPSIQLAG